VQFAAAELRNYAPSFEVPHNRIQAAILKIADAGHTVSVTHIAAELADCPAFSEVDGIEYLRAMAGAAPATTSPENVRKQMSEALRTWRHLGSPLPKAGDVELVTADTIEPEKVDWVWPGWLAAGKLHLIAGSPGTGKTTLCLAMASIITTAGAFPCGACVPCGSVLMWTGEDDLADSIIPRFLACGGNRSRLHFVAGVREDDGSSRPFDPAYDVEGLVTAARNIKDLKLLIVDPVVSAVAGDSHKNTETRRALQPLVDFAANAGVAVLGVTHYSKGTAGRDPAERVTGSLAFVAVSRLVMVTAKPKEPGDSWRLVRAKSNIGPDGGGFEYDLQQIPVDEPNGIFGQSIEWGAPLEGSALALLAEVEAPQVQGNSSALDAAVTWLPEMLGTGTVPVKFLEGMALERGHSWATVRRAKIVLGVKAIKEGAGWLWRMPNMLKFNQDAHTKNDERLSALEDAHMSAFEDAQDAHQNGVSALAAFEHLADLVSEIPGASQAQATTAEPAAAATHDSLRVATAAGPSAPAVAT
jgi:putative DNA primase/helicase